MKYKLTFLCLIFIMFIAPVNASSSISLECPSSSNIDSIINCDIIVNSDDLISAVSTELKVSNNLEFISFTTASLWQGTGDFGDIELYTSPSINGTIKLGVASIKVLDSNSKTGTVILDNTKFYLANFNGISGNKTSTNLKILSNNNNLSNISLSKGSISPSFNKNILDYQAVVDNDNVVISVDKEDSSSIVSGDGFHSLKEGLNNFIITVTSESGIVKKYNIAITRPPKSNDKDISKSEDNKENKSNPDVIDQNKTIIKLKNLEIKNYDLEFDENKNNYYLNLLNNENKLEIKAIPSDDNIKVTILGNEDLKEGDNEIVINLEDNSGNKNTYIIVAKKSKDICLVKDVTIKGYSLNFDCNIHEYSLKIKDVDSLNIEVIPINENTSVNIYNNNKLENNSIITIIVNNEKYLINIIKDNDSIDNTTNNKINIGLIIVSVIGLLYLIGRFIVKKKLFYKNK